MNKTFLAIFAAVLLCNSVRGQADLTFAGGSGAPLTLTLAQSMRYVINANHGPYQPTFFFAGVPTTGFGSPILMNGNVFFTVNSGPPQAVTLLSFGSGGIILAQNSTAIANFGDTITLFAGTLVSTSNVFQASLPSGQYVTYIPGAGATSNQISTNGVPIPEPTSVQLMGIAGAALCVIAWWRYRSARAVVAT
jgi:hypothetical protein